MSEKVKRRDFLKGATTGVGLGVLAAMGVYSYSPMRKQFFPEVARKNDQYRVCRKVKVTNVSETSWFENAVLMGDIKGAADCWSTSTITTGRPSATVPVSARAVMPQGLKRSSISCPTGSTKPGTSACRTASIRKCRRVRRTGRG